MKKIILFGFLIFLWLSLFSQEIFIKQSVVINVEVPVRVFERNRFVENLILDDFEVFEDGVPQKIEAVYLVKKRTIERSEEKKRFAPETSRNFFIFFEISDYIPGLGEAIDYLCENVILPGDNLYVISPLKTYRLKERALQVKSKADIARELKGILRKDALAGNSEYRNTIQELTALARTLSAGITTDPETQEGYGTGAEPPKELDSFTTSHYVGMDFDEQLIHYEGLLGKLEVLRKVDQIKLFEFARILKEKEGQKYVFLFYQREFIPQIEPRILIDHMNKHQKNPYIVQTLSRISELSKRNVSIDVDGIKRAYADSSTAIHFLFISKPSPIIPGVHFEEHSEDIFQPFREMARATGGFADSSFNASSLLQNALQASENYYLLYYSPKDYSFDGKFKEIKVRVKDRSYAVIHRAGYFAN